MKENQNNILAEAFSESLKTELVATVANLGEVALDSFFKSDIVKDIPFLSTVVSLFNIGHSIGDAFYLKKLATFIDEFNKGTANAKALEKHKSLFLSNPDKFQKEIERILVLINRFIDCEKSRYLAKLYRAYLDTTISWNDFMKYSQVIDQLFISDLEPLFLEGVLLTKRSASDDVLRLSALGLLVEVNDAPQLDVERGTLNINTTHKADEAEYLITDFGAKLVEIIKEI